MTRDQTSILWLGLILIALNIILNLAEFKSVIFGSGSAAPSDNAPSGNSNAPLAPGAPPPRVAPGQPQPQNTPGLVAV